MKNKCTLEDIEGAIVKEESFKLGLKTTVVLLTLKNGFEVIGKSGCVDPSNYDHELGVKYARERALNEVWMLEGYALQNKLNETQAPNE